MNPNEKTFPEKAREIVALAHDTDPEYRDFGANIHKYELNPPAKLSEVRKFEKEYNIKLPEGFVQYLTEVGNGGAGPFYGIYSLDMIKKKNPLLKKCGSKKTFIDQRFNKCNSDYCESSVLNEWKNICNELKNSDSSSSGEPSEIELKIAGGILNIGTRGGSSSNVLIIDGGENNGKIAIVDTTDENSPPVLTNYSSFEEWFLHCFKVTIYGNNYIQNNIKACNKSFMYYLHERDNFNKKSFDEFLYALSHVTLYDIETYTGLEYVIRQIWRHICFHFDPNDSFNITNLPDNYIELIENLEKYIDTYKWYVKQNMGDILNEKY